MLLVVATVTLLNLSAAAPSAASAKSVTLGIGAIRWSDDSSDAAFEAFRYFRNNAPKQNGSPTKAMLADFYTDSDWYLDGELHGSVQSVMKARAWTYSLILTSVSGVVTAGALVAFLVTKLPSFLIVGAVSLPLLIIGAVAMLVTKQFANETEGSVMGEFTLRREGKKVASFSVSPTQPRESFAEEPPEPGRSRDGLLAPVFAQVKINLEREMKKAPVSSP